MVDESGSQDVPDPSRDIGLPRSVIAGILLMDIVFIFMPILLESYICMTPLQFVGIDIPVIAAVPMPFIGMPVSVGNGDAGCIGDIRFIVLPECIGIDIGDATGIGGGSHGCGDANPVESGADELFGVEGAVGDAAILGIIGIGEAGCAFTLKGSSITQVTRAKADGTRKILLLQVVV